MTYIPPEFDAQEEAEDMEDRRIAKILIRQDDRFADDWYSADRWTPYVKEQIRLWKENA